MARDKGLEELVRDQLDDLTDLAERPMFGGWAWLYDGHLLCGARDDGVLIRLGKENERWALAIGGVVPMISRDRVMPGWVRIEAGTFADDQLAARLIGAALTFVRTLPPK